MADHQSASTPEKVFSQFRSIQDLQPESVRKLALPDPARVRNLFAITGKAERTVSRVLGDGTVLYTSAGDGLVTLEASHMEGVPTWQVDAPHGMLGCNELLTESLLDLLSRGAAPKLKRVIGPALTVDGLPTSVDGPLFFPSEDDLLDVALCGKPPSQFDIMEHPITIGVSHGHLRQARFPVMVGHYESDMMLAPKRLSMLN